jgi:hypothetical protein
VILYAPYWNPTRKRGELRRYEVTPCPLAFQTTSSSPAAITVADNNITVRTAGFPSDVLVIPRAVREQELAGPPVTTVNARMVVDKILDFDITIREGHATVNVLAEGNRTYNQETRMGSGSSGRN